MDRMGGKGREGRWLRGEEGACLRVPLVSGS